MYSVLFSYQVRLNELHAAAAQLRVGQMIAMGVLLVAIATCCILTYLSLTKRNVYPWSGVAPLAVTGYSMNRYFKRRSELLKTLRIRSFYEKGISRLNGTWAGSGQSGSEFMEPDHSYAQDLNVFGRGSLFELICTCRTQVGQRTLADYLLRSVPIEESVKRQEAVKELYANAILREQITLLGKYEFQQSSWTAITDWLAEPTSKSPYVIRAVALLSSLLLTLLILFGWDQTVAWSVVGPWIALLLGCNAAIGILYRNRVIESSQSVRSAGMELNVLREGLQLMQTQKFTSNLLKDLVSGALLNNPPARIRTLERLAQAFIGRDREWFYLGSRALLVGTQLFFAIERWKQKHTEEMRRGLSVWGEFEALVALANYAYERPENVFPRFSTDQLVLDAKAVGHPLLPLGKCVRNDIALSQQTRFYLVSGSNMAGKSTLLRTIGLNVVLASSGAPVRAERMTLSRFHLCTSMAIQDSLLDGKSKFLAEMDRIKLALTVSNRDGSRLFLIDELLSGTNSVDRRTAAELILRAFIEQGAIGAVSTHDLSLTEIAEVEGLHGKNVHMASQNETDPLMFDFILKPGVATHTNALAIARLAGVPG